MESNISGFLGMSRSNYNEDTQPDYSSPSTYRNREANRRKHYIESGYKSKKGINVDIDTGEILDFIPKIMRTNSRYYKNKSLPKIPLPSASTAINLAIVGGIGLMAYKLYNKFFSTDGSDIVNERVDAGSKAVANLTVDSNQTKASILLADKASLTQKGFAVSKLHKDSADAFHQRLNVFWVDDEPIVKAVLQQDIQTFRLVNQAYSIRKLEIYNAFHIGSLLHHPYDFQGNLKDHLSYCLNSESVNKIRSYLSVI